MKRVESFLQCQAQITQNPFLIDIKRAEGVYIYDVNNKQYIDLIAGVSTCTLGHSNPIIIDAIKTQLDLYTHVMVYGEFIQTPQLDLAKKLVDYLPEKLNSCYFVNSGTEAIEGAIKLAKRINKRTKVISCINSYHGSTQGSLSAIGTEVQKTNYRPLIPDHINIRYNNFKDLDILDQTVCCIIIEPVQGGTGFICAEKDWLIQIREKCDYYNIELIYDEIQTGFGRTGHMFGYEIYDIHPDILCIAKGMGGGMPIGAFISHKIKMDRLSYNPELGHITTFGGHPVSCAASLATLNTLLGTSLIKSINKKRNIFLDNLTHNKIQKIHGIGLMLAIEFLNIEDCQYIVQNTLNNGVITFYFLFDKKCMRISPPLTINNEEIKTACEIITNSINQYYNGKV